MDHVQDLQPGDWDFVSSEKPNVDDLYRNLNKVETGSHEPQQLVNMSTNTAKPDKPASVRMF